MNFGPKVFIEKQARPENVKYLQNQISFITLNLEEFHDKENDYRCYHEYAYEFLLGLDLLVYRYPGPDPTDNLQLHLKLC